MPYTSAADLKAYLDIPSGTTTDDTLLATLIARAQAIVDAHCRQTFEAATDTTRTFDADLDVDGRDLILDAPLCAITSVTNGDGNAVSGTHYVTVPRNGTPWYRLTLKRNAPVQWTYSGTPEGAISVVGRWAYSTTAPADIVQACTRLAAYLYRQRDNALDLDRTVVVGDTTLMPVRMPADVMTILRPYRRLI